MEDGVIVVIALIGYAISLWILYSIISGASRSKSILKIQRMQVELLKEIALKHGVDAARVDEIIETHNTVGILSDPQIVQTESAIATYKIEDLKKAGWTDEGISAAVSAGKFRIE